MTDAERPLPLVLQERLSELLDLASREEGLAAEMARARREFFGGEQPHYARSEQDLDLAAQRFAEWFLLERESDNLGQAPIDRLLDAADPALAPAFEMLRDSRVGVFLVEGRGRSLRVRDLQGGERLSLEGVEGEMRPGDLLVGRLFVREDESHVPSAAAAVVGGAPQLAVAFQRDVKQLALDRRLDQAELEQLLVQRLGQPEAPGPEIRAPEDDRPIEHLEAELQQLLAEVGKDEELPATRLSGALRAANGPGEVIGPLLDELAFETDIDLERLREALLRLWNAHHTQRAEAAPRELDATPPKRPQLPKPAAESPPKAAPEHSSEARNQPAQGPSPRFQPRPGESLGERLARRIEEGLAADENVENMFEQVEELMGESIEEPDEDGYEELADGDLEPLVREFAWENGLSSEDELRLQAFLAQLRELPVPRVDVESLEVDDFLRFFLHVWLSHAPDRRVAELQGLDALCGSFARWLAETQGIAVAEELAGARQALLEPLDRIDRASRALAAGAPAADAERGLLRVVDLLDEVVVAADPERGQELEVRTASSVVADLQLGDLLIAEWRIEGAGQHATLHGPVVVLPKTVEHLVSG